MRLALALATCACVASACSRESGRVSVGAAAILRHAMPELVARHRELGGAQVDVVYGASDALVARVKSGAALDVLVLAEESAFGGTNTGDPRTIATTSLVLVGPVGAAHRFATLRDGGVVAIGDPASVPVGRYARSYLAQLGAWDSVRPRAVLGGDAAGVLALATRGTAHVAIVYATDAVSAMPLVILDRADGGPLVEVAAAVTAPERRPAAAAFVTFLESAEARAILERHGFAPPAGVVR